MRDRLQHWLRLDQYNNAEQRWLAIVLYSIEAINFSVTFLATVVMAANHTLEMIYSLIPFLITIVLVVLTWLRKLTLVTWLMPTTMYLVAVAIIAQGTDIAETGIFIFPAIIAVAGLLLRRRGVVTYTLLSIVAIIIIDLLPMDHTEHTPLVVISILFALIGGVNFLLITLLNILLQQARLNEAQLEERNRELNSMQAWLEEQVAERTHSAEQARLEAEAAWRAIEKQAWIAAGQVRLTEAMSGEQTILQLAENILEQVCDTLEIPAAVLYAAVEHGLRPIGGYAVLPDASHLIQAGEGPVGQALKDKQPVLLGNVPAEAIHMGQIPAIQSTLGSSNPHQVLIQPLLDGNRVAGVLELLLLDELEDDEQEYVQLVSNAIAVALSTVLEREKTNELLAETQRQAEELQAQEEELRIINESLQANQRSKGRKK